MTSESLAGEDWRRIVDRLGGAAALETSARQTKALLRAREIENAVMLLRMILAYCLGERGLRSTVAWATAIGLVDISNVALLYRLRQCGDWLTVLVGEVLASGAPKPVLGRPIRIIDGTSVPKKGAEAKRHNGIWRIHADFDLPSERFGHFELTDETEGETLDRIPVVRGEIRLADRAYLQPDRMATVIDAGADIVVRAGWKSARWLDADSGGTALPFDLIGALKKAGPEGLIDRPIRIGRKSGRPLALRLIAVRKPAMAAEAARCTARREAQRGRHKIAEGTLVAAGWVILITSLPAKDVTAEDVLALYRLRWRIELAFKRLKSLVGLKGPPGTDPRSARPYILAQLLLILLLEPIVDEFEGSPRSAQAA